MSTFENVYLPKNVYKTVRTVIDPASQGEGRAATGINPNLGLNLSQFVQDAIDNNFITITTPPADVEQTTASNGLYLSTYDVRLGGALRENTTINMTGYVLNFDNNSIQLGDYGIGTHDPGSDPTYYLGVNATGIVVERTAAQILIDLGGPFTSTNIYNTSDSLTGNRTVTQGAFTLNFATGTGTFTAGAGNVLFNLQPASEIFRLGDYTGVGNSTGITANDTTRQIKIGDVTGAQNDTYIQVDDANSIININNEARLVQYGVGTYSGTPAYALFVDATGNVIEEAVPAGPSPFYNIYTTSDNVLSERSVGLDDFNFYIKKNEFDFDDDDEAMFGIEPNSYRVFIGGTSGDYTREVRIITSDETNDETQGVYIASTTAHIDIISSEREVRVVGDNGIRLTVGIPETGPTLWLDPDNGDLRTPLGRVTELTKRFMLSDYGIGTYAGTPVYLLGVNASGDVLETAVADYSQNLWATFTGDVGTTTANTTTDTFNIIGGAGIDTSIAGDTITITNTGAGAVYTTSNGISFLVDDIRLGGAAAGGGAWTYTSDRYLYANTFDLIMQTSTGYIGRFDGGNNFLMLGNNALPRTQLHVIKQGETIGAATLVGTEVALFESAAGSASVGIISHANYTARLYFGSSADAVNGAYISYPPPDPKLQFNVSGNTVAEFNADGSIKFNDYGDGTFVGTATYYLAVDVDGNVIEETLPGAAAITASQGLIKVGNDIRFGNTAAGTGTHDFTVNRYIYLGAFELFFGTPTESALLHLDGATDRVGIGLSTPQGRLHIETATTGTTVNTSADEFIIENSTNTGMSIISGQAAGNTGAIYWGAAADNQEAQVAFTPFSGQMVLGTAMIGGNMRIATGNNTSAISIDSSQEIQLNSYGDGLITGTETYYLGVDANGYVIELSPPGVGPGPNLWLTFNADTGTTSANTATDTLTITGGTSIATSIVGDVLTINYDGAPVTDTSIYIVDGSLTGNRNLYGTTRDLRFDFTNGANVGISDWQDTITSFSVTNGTTTASHQMSATSNTLSLANATSTHNLIMNNAGNTLSTISTHTSSTKFVGLTHIVASSSPEIIMYANNNAGGDAHYRVAIDGSNIVTLYAKTAAVDGGTAVIGQVATLTNASSGRWEWQTLTGGADQNLWATFVADSGSTTANSLTDTFNIIGGTGITTAIAGDILTITATGGADTYLGNTDQTIDDPTRIIDLDGNELSIRDNSGTPQTIMNISLVDQYCMDILASKYYGWYGAGGQYRAGSWDTSFTTEGTYRKLNATATEIGMYTNDGTNTAKAEIVYASDAVILNSTRSANVSTITIEGASNIIDSTNGGGSYSRIITNGSTDTLTLTVFDGGSDTNSLTLSATRSKASGAWVDSGVINDVTARNSNHNDYSPTDIDKKRIIRYNSTGFHYMTGLDAAAANAEDGMIIELWNVGTTAFNISHESASSIATNRIRVPGGTVSGAIRISDDGCAIFRYDAISSRWRIISSN